MPPAKNTIKAVITDIVRRRELPRTQGLEVLPRTSPAGHRRLDRLLHRGLLVGLERLPPAREDAVHARRTPVRSQKRTVTILRRTSAG